MRPKTYDLIQKCVEDGVASGWSRAHKHTDNPTESAVREEIERAVMGEICDWFDFPLIAEGD